MSAKLNAEELAAKRFPYAIPGIMDDLERRRHIHTYAAAIREHSQPLADERDELREALRECELFIRVLGLDSEPARKTAESARAILAKYLKP